MCAFGLKLGHDHDRDNDLMLLKAHERMRIRQQDGRVEDVGAVSISAGGAS